MSYIVNASLVLGCLFVLVACVGLISMPSILYRMHAATKSSTVGMFFILIAVALHFNRMSVWIECLFTILFIFLTIPVAAQLLAKYGHSED